MRALVYHGPGSKAWEEVPRPVLQADTDAVVRVDKTTICGTDLHILKGDVPAMVDGRIIGHEAVGTVEEVGTGVKMSMSVTMSWSRASPPAAPAGSAARDATANVSVEAVGSSATRSTVPRPSTCGYRLPTRRRTRLRPAWTTKRC